MRSPRTILQRNEQGIDSGRVRTWTSRFALPRDLVRQARRRLGLLALAIGCLSLTAGPIALSPLVDTGSEWILGITLACTVVVSFALFYATRSTRLSDSSVLLLGLAYEILLCLSAATVMTWDTYELIGRAPELTFASVFIVMFPLFVPCTPRLTLLTSLIAASMNPLGLGILYWLNAIDQPPMTDLVGVSIGPFAAVALAYMGARVLHNIGTELVRARELGSYTLEEKLGSGGMGEVWRASHQMLVRPAAVKLIHPETLAEDDQTAQAALSRFEQEAQTTASLRSPHTVELYDFGRAEDGAFYYVMELLDGLDLSTLVDKHGPQDPARVIHLLDQACHSLKEAHRAGLIHRDIKPANLFVCRYGSDDDFVKVLDFGLVKEVGAQPTKAQLTEREVVMGTPDFMPPELAMAEENIDGRADLYSLGCVAYWLLTGRMLFSAESPIQILMKHVNETPVAPSTHSQFSIPPELDTLVLQCLEKDPANRPNSAGELSAKLRAIPLDRQWVNEDARRWWETHSSA